MADSKGDQPNKGFRPVEIVPIFYRHSQRSASMILDLSATGNDFTYQGSGLVRGAGRVMKT